uniref:FYVE-type domain-containing protein n=1 Tax=Spongospora subterranea TaxID=70186 RepID=A0A0H5R777_9EUKA|eukprot:CRZ09676.1 hypothetical protein [Spongospora subterranea]
MGQAQSTGSIIVWERDSPCCSHCATAFSLGNGRHHCRSCGDVVCQVCSPYTGYLPQLGYPADIEQRVCRLCAAKPFTVTLHEMAAADLIKGHFQTHQQTCDDILSDAVDIFAAALQMPSFNPYLLDHLRAKFSEIFNQAYDRALYHLESILRAPIIHPDVLDSSINACERVRAVFLDHSREFDPIDIQLLSDQIDCARSQQRRPPTPELTSSPLPSCLRGVTGSASSPKRVRFSPVEAGPAVIQQELERQVMETVDNHDGDVARQRSMYITRSLPVLRCQ